MLNSHLMCSLTLTLISSLLLLCSQSLQLCQTLCDPMDYSPPGSSVHAISQARILEWSAIPCSRGSSHPRVQTRISSTGRRILHHWATWEVPWWRRVRLYSPLVKRRWREVFCHHVPFAQGPGAPLWGWAKSISLQCLRKSWKPWLSLYSRTDPGFPDLHRPHSMYWAHWTGFGGAEGIRWLIHYVFAYIM